MKTPMDPDAHYTLLAMRALERLVPAALNRAPPPVRAKFNNALLNVAVNRLIDIEGPTTAATILWRLADLLENGHRPTPESPIELTGVREIH